MIEQPPFTDLGLAERSLFRGVITTADHDEHFVVQVRHGSEEWLVVADLVVTSDAPVHLRPGDGVLCWTENEDRERGVILGRIGAPVASAPAQVTAAENTTAAIVELPDELVLEAKHSLTLRVGAGSITIREDGKILIKGKDLVSHAQRLNRIKGGAVQIN
jgi:hypothetical protein